MFLSGMDNFFTLSLHLFPTPQINWVISFLFIFPQSDWPKYLNDNMYLKREIKTLQLNIFTTLSLNTKKEYLDFKGIFIKSLSKTFYTLVINSPILFLFVFMPASWDFTAWSTNRCTILSWNSKKIQLFLEKWQLLMEWSLRRGAL